MNILKSLLGYLKNCRSEDKFDKNFNEVRSIADDLDIDDQQQQFPQLTSVTFRPRKKKKNDF